MKVHPMRWLPSLFVVMMSAMQPLSASSEIDLLPLVQRAEFLQKEGQYKEMRELIENAPELEQLEKAEDQAVLTFLGGWFSSTSQLGQLEEAVEGMIERLQKRYPTDWRIWHVTSNWMQQLPHYGSLIDGKYIRGSYSGISANSEARDRVWQLQWGFKAYELYLDQAKSGGKFGAQHGRNLLNYLSSVILAEGAPWSLQLKTELETAPEIEIQEPKGRRFRGRTPSPGYPVDEEGKPIFFEVPQDLASAKNDGERWRWILEQKAQLAGASKEKVQLEFSQQILQWLDVHTLAHEWVWQDLQDKVQSKEADEALKAKYALEHLGDHETIVKLASGIERIELPESYQFLRILRELGESKESSIYDRAISDYAESYENRRQSEKALEGWKKLVGKLESKYPKRAEIARERAKAIEMPLGKMTAIQPSLVGSPAQVELMFRNAKLAKFTAREVKVAELWTRVKANLAKNAPRPEERFDYQKTPWLHPFAGLIQAGRLNSAQQEGLLSDQKITWETALEPADKHQDRRVQIKTPLEKAGYYFVEVEFQDGNRSHCLVEIQSMIMVQKSIVSGKQGEASSLILLTDAKTGKPLPRVKVNAVGYLERHMNVGGKSRMMLRSETRSAETDAQGLVTFKALSPEMNWAYEVTDAEGVATYLGFGHVRGFYGEDEENQNKMYVITDRPIYRPDQSVHVTGWLRRINYDEKVQANAFANSTVKVEVKSEKHEVIYQGDLEVDAKGQFQMTVDLPKNATLGYYRVALHSKGEKVNGQAYFRVEEYKKPEFEVVITPPTETVLLGDKFRFEIGANYFFGGAVKEGSVKYKVERVEQSVNWAPVRPWDWLYGPGYWWRNSAYSWYEGHRFGMRCLPSWYPSPTPMPELIAEATVPLNEEGKVTVTVDTSLAKALHGSKDHEYKITAEVIDASRRAVFGGGSVSVNRFPLKVYAWLDQGFYREGDPAKLNVQVRNPQGAFVAGNAVVKVMEVSVGETQVSETEVASFPLKIDQGDKPAELALQWPKAGQYRLQIEFKSEQGVEAKGMVNSTVRGGNFDGSGYRMPDLEVVSDREEYRVGDTAKLLINTDQEGATVYIFERPRGQGYALPVVKTLPKGKSLEHELTITATDQPNVFVEVVTVHRGRGFVQVISLPVPPVKHVAELELKTPQTKYAPRDKSKVAIKVTDAKGEPVRGRVVITAYDKALDALAGEASAEDIRKFFWGFYRHHSAMSQVSTDQLSHWLPQPSPEWHQIGRFGTEVVDPFGLGGVAIKRGAPTISRAAASPVAAMASAQPEYSRYQTSVFDSKSADLNDSIEGPEVQLRDNFADSILWNAVLETDAQGRVEVPIEFADDLTTWNLKAWVVSPNAEVGQASIEVITQKDLFVRPQAPRFFVEKDTLLLSGIVHNLTDEAQEAQVSLSFDGDQVLLQEGESATRTVQIPAHGEKRVDWKVRAVKEGEIAVLMKVTAPAGSDAVKKTYPVMVHGMEKQLAWSEALRKTDAEVRLEMNVPKERREAQTTLTIQYSPSLALAMVDSLPYLIDYPYGCVEQTLNRFVPAVQTQQVLSKLGIALQDIAKHRANLNAQALGTNKFFQPAARHDAIYSSAKLQELVKEGMTLLQQAQNDDGSWSWWPGARYADPYMTAQVVEGLHRAQALGAEIDATVLSKGIDWLASREKSELRKLNLPEKNPERKSQADELDAYVHQVLLQTKASVAAQAMRDRLYQDRLKLSRIGQAKLGLSFGLAKESDRRDMVIRNLSQFLQVDDSNQTAWLEQASGAMWWRWYHAEIETMAAYLQLLVQKNPQDEIAPKLVKFLLNQRTGNAKWQSTRDTAAVIAAFADYVVATKEDQPDMQVEIVLDGKVIHQAPLNPSTLFTQEHRVVLEGEQVTSGKHELLVRRKGSGNLYVNAYLNYFSLEDPILKAGAEVQVERRLYRLIPRDREGVVAGSAGQVVKQREQVMDRKLIKDDEWIKSGEQIEVELIVTSRNDYEYLMLEDRKAAGMEALDGNSGWVYDGGLSAYREFRDASVNHYFTALPRGTHSLRYRVRAEIPGRFSVLPTVIYGMYSPELRGNASEQKVQIQD